MEVSMHASREGLKVKFEFPENSGCIQLVGKKGATITLYLPIGQWWIMRSLPKAADYQFHRLGKNAVITDPIDADAEARIFYRDYTAKLPEVITDKKEERQSTTGAD